MLVRTFPLEQIVTAHWQGPKSDRSRAGDGLNVSAHFGRPRAHVPVRFVPEGDSPRER